MLHIIYYFCSFLVLIDHWIKFSVEKFVFVLLGFKSKFIWRFFQSSLVEEALRGPSLLFQARVGTHLSRTVLPNAMCVYERLPLRKTIRWHQVCDFRISFNLHIFLRRRRWHKWIKLALFLIWMFWYNGTVMIALVTVIWYFPLTQYFWWM